MSAKEKITTALLLAAGTGSRLRPLTHAAPKCLTVVGGRPILGRLLDNLKQQGIIRLIVVTGHLEDQIRTYLEQNDAGLDVDFIFNPDYRTTNNIYSLWLARQLIDEPFVLIESDLVFDASMLSEMLYPGRIAISRILPWMNGTTVELDARNGVASFHAGHELKGLQRYKTVNIYSLSMASWRRIVKRLRRYVTDMKLNGYYEVVFANMVMEGSLNFEAVFFAKDRWYEIDTVQDLRNADLLYMDKSAARRRLPASAPTVSQ